MWMRQQTHPKWMTGNGQLIRDAFRINDLLRNPYFSAYLPFLVNVVCENPKPVGRSGEFFSYFQAE